MSDLTNLRIEHGRPRFPLGNLYITPGVHDIIQFHEEDLGEYVRRHHHGDWGDLDPEDRQLNNRALTDGSRILSAYKLKDGETKIWIITDAEVMEGRRLSTTVLLPDEY